VSRTPAQEVVLAHLRSAYIGPEGGADEVVTNPPNRQYTIGMLYPTDPPDQTVEQRLEAEQAGVDEMLADVEDGDVEENGAAGPVAEEWRPASTAISFVTNRQSATVRFAGACYEPLEDDGPPRWRRRAFEVDGLELSRELPRTLYKVGEIECEIGSRWREYGKNWLVTVHVRSLAEGTGDGRLDVARTLYQVALEAMPADGGAILEYDTSRKFDFDDETAELRLRYSNRTVYAAGHGMAADWEVTGDRCTRIWLDPAPSFVVPAIETTGFEEGSPEAGALSLEHLSRIDIETGHVVASLDAFVVAFTGWVEKQEAKVAGFGDDEKVAERIVERSRAAAERMQAAVDLLRHEDSATLRVAFALGMKAMRLQMLQGRPGQEPSWRPFQLGFLLVSVASTVDDGHADRELVDLIWFPTGGGKTEAYLGLAAIEIFRRRLVHGMSGGGTAVITRYTLRLLTAQQFQRAATLICAMELLRRPGPHADPRVQGLAPFSIGLWIGNEATPGTHSEARDALKRLYKAARPEEANKFQVESCPWCGTELLPKAGSSDESAYGVRRLGNEVAVYCTNTSCEFHQELPVLVVDEAIYADPPTILLATVDKFARLQFRPEAGRLLGLETAFRQASLIIQDELHLLSGPLGTTVAVFDAVIQQLLALGGSAPKVIASTATIRASEKQVQGLYGRQVALYPPAGLDDDQTFFSRPVESGEGRLYVGLMPQSLSQMSAVVAAASPLLEIPEVVGAAGDAWMPRDAYWTVVMYHNSLRELGRTGTLVSDDVNARLGARAQRLGLTLRNVRGDRVLELTSRRGPEELPKDLKALKKSVDDTDEAVDVVLSSNMLSVGIDVPRLALMLMVGQPKTTAEYIQATSRVGRGDVKGVVTTLFRSNRARDRSHFETFRAYHETLYRSVEPTSVTPWSLASRERSLAGALVALLRHAIPELAANDAAGRFDLDGAMSGQVETLVERLLALVERSEHIEVEETREEVERLLRDWDRRARDARDAKEPLRYERKTVQDSALLKRFDQPGEGWVVGDSMRSVEPNVAIEIREPSEGGPNGSDQA
jgi:hypothetical protein